MNLSEGEDTLRWFSIHFMFFRPTSIRIKLPISLSPLCAKIINKPSKGGHKLKNFEQSLKREVSVMKVLRHPNVVTLWEVINDPRSRKVGRASSG